MRLAPNLIDSRNRLRIILCCHEPAPSISCRKDRRKPFIVVGILADVLGLRLMFSVTSLACLASATILIRLLPGERRSGPQGSRMLSPLLDLGPSNRWLDWLMPISHRGRASRCCGARRPAP